MTRRGVQSAAAVILVITVTLLFNRPVTNLLREKLQVPGPVERLLALANDPNQPTTIRRNAVLSLGEIGDRKAVKPLARLLIDSEQLSDPCYHAIKNIGLHAGPYLLARFEECRVGPAPTGSTNTNYCGRLAELLGEVEYRKSIPALEAAVVDTKALASVRIGSAAALGKMKASASVPILLVGLSAQDTTVVAACAAAIGKALEKPRGSQWDH